MLGSARLADATGVNCHQGLALLVTMVTVLIVFQCVLYIRFFQVHICNLQDHNPRIVTKCTAPG